ncbi:MAG: DUF2326 domain-containing protein, partial [Spirochaetales bacterium]|nr:DUF2326 domain-containing protein [Spirochaetales bacterium]
KPKKVFFNLEKISVDKFKKEIEKLCFSIPEDTAYLSFRSLIPFFIRPKKESYVDCKKPGKIGSEYQTLLYNSFLIGLDINLAEKKYILRKEQERIRNLEKNFKNDSLLRDFFTGDKDVSLTLVDLEDKIVKIEQDLEKFQVADDYHDIQKEADSIEKKLFDINNEITIIKNNIDNIEKSLNITPSMSSLDLEAIYAESKVLFPETVKKTLDDIDDFYRKLLSNRIRRLSEQRNLLKLSHSDKLEESNLLKDKLDGLMKYLGKHQALDLFISLSQKVAELKSEKGNLEKYQVLQSEYKSKERQTEKDMIDLSEITDNYLVEIEENTRKIRDCFRALAKTFYPQSVAGLTINTNEGENQLVFDIEPKIESDGSDGISNVKLFCYDLSILFEGQNHNIDFIFHDSRLYDGIDERQKAAMFKTIRNYFSNNDKQYIATVNQNQLNEIKANLSSEEYKSIIEDNTILTLTDDLDSEKLLGIKVDIGNK